MNLDVTLVSIYEVLSDIDILEDENGNLKEFSLNYFPTKGHPKGQMRTKLRVSKKSELIVRKMNEVLPMQEKSGNVNHKEARTIPLYDQEAEQPFTLKIYSIIGFNGMRCVRPIFSEEGKPIYPTLDVNGNLQYND